MRKSSSKFVNGARYGDFKTPGKRDFSLASWTDAYVSLGEGSQEEKSIYEAGLAIGAELPGLWSQLDAFKIETRSFAGLIVSLMETASIQSGAYEERYVQSPRQGSVHVGADRIQGATYDQLLTALGEALSRALVYFFGRRADIGGERATSHEEAGEILNLMSRIYALEFFMERALWCGWRAEGSDPLALLPPGDALTENEAIAQNQNDVFLAEITLGAMDAWAKGGFRGWSPGHIRLSTRAGTRAIFEFFPQPPETMPETIPLYLSSIPDWLEPLLGETTVELAGASIGAVVSGWILLRDAFAQVLKHEFEKASDEREPVIGILRTDALALLVSRGMKKRQADAVLEFLCFDGGLGDALWRSPLVPIEGVLYAFEPALLIPNLGRNVDLWLDCVSRRTAKGRKEGLAGVRGGAFEQHVRTTIARLMAGNSCAEGAVLAKDILMGGHQIDLLWRVGSIVYVGECKFSKYAANPADFGRCFIELEKGAGQALLRCEALERLKPQVARQTCYGGRAEALELRPLLIVGQFLGSGLTIEGVPCVDVAEVEVFFSDDFMEVVDPTLEAAEHEEALRFWYRQEGGDFGRELQRMLENPASVFFRKHCLGWIEHVLPGVLDGGRLFKWHERVVRYPEGAAFRPHVKACIAEWNRLDEV
jgi:hypothetical protein